MRTIISQSMTFVFLRAYLLLLCFSCSCSSSPLEELYPRQDATRWFSFYRERKHVSRQREQYTLSFLVFGCIENTIYHSLFSLSPSPYSSSFIACVHIIIFKQHRNTKKLGEDEANNSVIVYKYIWIPWHYFSVTCSLADPSFIGEDDECDAMNAMQSLMLMRMKESRREGMLQGNK